MSDIIDAIREAFSEADKTIRRAEKTVITEVASTLAQTQKRIVKVERAVLAESDKGFKIMEAGMDAYLAKKLIEMKREADAPDVTLDQKKSAIPTKVAMQALYSGALTIAVRVIPGMAIPYLESVGEGLSAKVGAFIAGKTLLGKIPGAGMLLSLVAGVAFENQYNVEMATHIKAALGEETLGELPGYPEPMRKQINGYVIEMKKRIKRETIKKAKVHTRNPRGRGYFREP